MYGLVVMVTMATSKLHPSIQIVVYIDRQGKTRVNDKQVEHVPLLCSGWQNEFAVS